MKRARAATSGLSSTRAHRKKCTSGPRHLTKSCSAMFGKGWHTGLVCSCLSVELLQAAGDAGMGQGTSSRPGVASHGHQFYNSQQRHLGMPLNHCFRLWQSNNLSLSLHAQTCLILHWDLESHRLPHFSCMCTTFASTKDQWQCATHGQHLRRARPCHAAGCGMLQLSSRWTSTTLPQEHAHAAMRPGGGRLFLRMSGEPEEAEPRHPYQAERLSKHQVHGSGR